MLRRTLIVLAVMLALGAGGLYVGLRYYQSASADPAFFEDAIQAFEARDRAAPPEPGAIVFVGSSSLPHVGRARARHGAAARAQPRLRRRPTSPT